MLQTCIGVGKGSGSAGGEYFSTPNSTGAWMIRDRGWRWRWICWADTWGCDSGRVPRQREWECMLNERGGAGEHEDGKEKERRERVEEGKGKGKERRRRSGGRKSSG